MRILHRLSLADLNPQPPQALPGSLGLGTGQLEQFDDLQVFQRRRRGIGRLSLLRAATVPQYDPAFLYVRKSEWSPFFLARRPTQPASLTCREPLRNCSSVAAVPELIVQNR